MKKKIGPQPMVWPHPVVLVGAVTDGKPDFATVAWTGVAASTPPHVTIALQPHRYSLRGIYQTRAFSINIPSEDLIKETDYCGIVSGKDTDKAKDCKFHVFYGETKGAPLIEECPVNLECIVRHLLNLGSHIMVVGEVIESHISENIMVDGKPSYEKAGLFVFGPGTYNRVGEPFADAFKIGRELKGGKA